MFTSRSATNHCSHAQNAELQTGDHMHAAYFHPFEWYSYSSLPHLRVFPILLRSGTLILVPHEL